MTILNFSILTLFIAIISCILAIGTLSKGDKEGRYLAVCLFLSAGVEISYLISILISNKFTMSLFSSIYFGLIDVMLAALVYYVMLIMEVAHCRMCRFGMTLIAIYTCFDIAVLMINPWKEIAIGYRYSEVSIQHWRYVPGTLYDMHLAFSYILIGIVFAMLIYKTIKTPSAYKSMYGGICAVLVVVVVINAIFLYTFNDQLPDISLFLYGIVSFVLYRNRYHYSKKRLFNQAYVGIIEEMSHPILLFDYEKNLVLNNGAAEYICEGLRKDDNGDVTLGDFIKECGFNEVTEFTENDVAFSWVDRRKGKEKSYRCDYHPFKDKKDHITGYLFIFTDNSTVIDVLTGFTNMNEFVRHVNGYTETSPIPVCVTACDINNLHGINMEMGEVAGDLFIKKLADLMREKFPEGTYFVRLNEANLLAVTLGVSDEIIDVAIADIRKTLLEEDNITIQTAKAVAKGGVKGALNASESAVLSMRARKMLDKDSAHSNLMDSLVQTLRECDDETEAHLSRTNDLGQKLANRLNLSDRQKSDLSLLCLLHDIGKVGIPLEILNKPGPLSQEEWEIMKSHCQKGYRIAKSSRWLDEISDSILYHHERWDGNGYPSGLKGEEIPLLSRIIAIIDTYDAMTNDRVYRKACSKAEAIAEIKRCAGTQFDPNLVEELIKVLDNEVEDKIWNVSSLSAECSKTAGTGEVHANIMQGKTKSYKKSNSRNLIYSRYTVDQDWKIIEVDDNFERITGYSRETVMRDGMHQEDLIPENDREEYLNLVRENFKIGNEAFIEHKIRCADGRLISVHCIGREFFNAVFREKRLDIVITKIDKD